jgi:four helix bundle protein
MNNLNFGFEDLELWKKTRLFKVELKKLTQTFPPEEKYRFADQILRSSRSINALIAEGHGRFTYPDQIHYCIQARGSLTETVNHLIDALDENYLTAEQFALLKNNAKEIERLINGYLVYLRKKRDDEKLKP